MRALILYRPIYVLFTVNARDASHRRTEIMHGDGIYISFVKIRSCDIRYLSICTCALQQATEQINIGKIHIGLI
jgi:hypothetical protein